MTDTLLIIGGLVYLGIGVWVFDWSGRGAKYDNYLELFVCLIGMPIFWLPAILLVSCFKNISNLPKIKIPTIKVPKRYRRGE